MQVILNFEARILEQAKVDLQYIKEVLQFYV
jgi:hypothetical protein